MAGLRRLLAYSVCAAIALPPIAYGQAPPPAAVAGAPAMRGVVLKAEQTTTHGRLLIEWPAGTNVEASAAAGSGLAIIRLPRAIEADASAFAKGAPNFVAAAALSADKRTIRIALVRGVRIVQSRNGTTQAIDLVLPDAPAPSPLGSTSQAGSPSPDADEAPQTATTETAPKSEPKKATGTPAKLANMPAPSGAPRVAVEASTAGEFTRITLSPTTQGGALPGHGFARKGDRMAIALPGLFGLDIASLRSQPPKRVRDAARYNSETDTSLILDLEPGAVVRHQREGNVIQIDILPPGASANSLATLQEEAAKAPKPDTAPKTTNAPAEGKLSEAAPPPPQDALTTGLSLAADQVAEAPRADPAPSGQVQVLQKAEGQEVSLEFPFESAAPAAIFRRGEALYMLFATKAAFNVSNVSSGRLMSRAEPIQGEGLSGVRIVAPPEVQATPTSVGNNWRVLLSPRKPMNARPITIDREQAPDGSSRVKALVPDAAATGSFLDPEVGDTVLVGMALGPPTGLLAKRSFLEASLPETSHGLIVTPRADDFELRRAVDGFVLVRPNGMLLTRVDAAAKAAGFAPTDPGFVDFNAWKIGPQADFARNLDQLRRAAAVELGDEKGSVRARMDLARFLLAWQLAPEAAGVLRQLRADVPTMQRAPELIALEGVAQALSGRGRQALDTLTQPEVAQDKASQLWAGLAAEIDGNAAEARARFERGIDMLPVFAPEQRAIFRISNGNAALALGDTSLATNEAGRALADATDPVTKLRATLLAAQAMAAAGRTDEALKILEQLERVPNREVAARAALAKAVLATETGKIPVAESIKALDALRYAWRGDGLEIEVLRRLGALYIQAGDIRSGLSTLASASSLRPDLPAARKLRDDLFGHFRHLFLEGGADGMDPIQALALFYDFRDLAPIGPDGDRMVRGLADRLVNLDLLPQATQLLQHQVDKRLEGFAKAQVATDLAAIYLMDRRPEEALKAIWGSRIAMLPEALNTQRRMIEAASMAELGRKEHALETIEFDSAPDANRLRTEIHMRAGEWTRAAETARATLPPAKARLEPEEAGEVLRAAVAAGMANDRAQAANLVATYGPAMANSAYAEAFKVVTQNDLPDPAGLQAAVATVTGGSPYTAMLKRLRNRLNSITPPVEGPLNAALPTGPTDGDPNVFRPAALVPEARPVGIPASDSAAIPVPQKSVAARRPTPSPRPKDQSARTVAQRPTAKPVTRQPAKSGPAQNPQGVQAPRDPPPIVTSR